MSGKIDSDTPLSVINTKEVLDDGFSVQDIENSSGPVTSQEPPNGGLAAWLVVFGGFCVS